MVVWFYSLVTEVKHVEKTDSVGQCAAFKVKFLYSFIAQKFEFKRGGQFTEKEWPCFSGHINLKIVHLVKFLCVTVCMNLVKCDKKSRMICTVKCDIK